MKRGVLFLVVLLSLPITVRSQAGPDLLDWRRYFPLEVDNRWEFVEVGSGEAFRLIITGDTLVEGEAAFTYRMEWFSEGRPLGVETGVVRYDEAGRVVGLAWRGATGEMPVASCVDLREGAGGTAVCGAETLTVEKDAPGFVRLAAGGEQRTYQVDAIKKYDGGSLAYAYGFGLGPYWWRTPALWNLEYARVDGRHYGEATLPAVGPDTLEARGYFPLAVGNEWQHTELAWGTPIPTYHRLRITGDTLVDGQRRFLYLRESFGANRDLQNTSTGTLWHGDGGGASIGLDAAFGDTLVVEGDSVFVGGAYDREVLLGNTPVRVEAVKTLRGSYHGVIYAHGLGKLSEVFWDGPTVELSFARIDGATYGRPVVTVGREASFELPSDVQLREVYPNPVTTQAEVIFTLARPGRAEVALFDVLGRRVLHTHGRYAAGAHRQRLDVSSLPTGSYFLRVTAAGETAVRPLVVRR